MPPSTAWRPFAAAIAAAALSACQTGTPPGTVAAASSCAAVQLPGQAALPANPKLPNPFVFQNGEPVRTSQDWQCRRAELGALVQHLQLGEKPPAHGERIEAQFAADTLQVSVTRADKTVTFPVKITYPNQGKAPYPAMIGVGMVSLNQAQLLEQGVAIVTFPNNEIGAQQNAASRGQGKFYELYGSGHPASAMTAWSWGISRFIDALEKTPQANLDPARLGVTGCSRNGKGAIVAGAFDERIALTIAQESGNGGASGWRVAESQRAAGQNVQTLRQIVGENVWFTERFKDFSESVDRLPFDQHSVMGLIAPRGLLVLENTSLEWLGNQSAYVTSMAARETWKAFGAADAMGFSQVGGHPHCQLPPSQFAPVNAFVKRFLLGDAAADTNVLESDGRFSKDLAPWIDWTTPVLRK